MNLYIIRYSYYLKICFVSVLPYRIKLFFTVSDIVHFFCTCGAVCDTWYWLKRQVMQLSNTGADVDDWDLVNLMFLNSSRDSEIVWMISTYVQYVWDTAYIKKHEVKLDKFFGYLTFKYKMYQETSPDELINLHYT